MRVPIFHSDVLSWREARKAGIVDQDVDLPAGRRHLIDGGDDGRIVRQVHRQAQMMVLTAETLRYRRHPRLAV